LLNVQTRDFGGDWCSAEMKRFLKLEGFEAEFAMGRFTVVKALWNYIKAHALKDGKWIRCDAEFKKLFLNRDRVNMFSMNTILNRHFPKKVSATTQGPKRPGIGILR
jgi:hypothetical protein